MRPSSHVLGAVRSRDLELRDSITASRFRPGDLLDEPSEQEAEAAAVAVARALDSAVDMLRPGTWLAGWRSPPALLGVRGGADHLVIVGAARGDRAGARDPR